MIIKVINKDFIKIKYGAIKYRKNEIMKFDKRKFRGTEVIVKSNLFKDINEICYRKN